MLEGRKSVVRDGVRQIAALGDLGEVAGGGGGARGCVPDDRGRYVRYAFVQAAVAAAVIVGGDATAASVPMVRRARCQAHMTLGVCCATRMSIPPPPPQ